MHTLTLLLNAQQPYRTIPYTDRIKTIAGWQAPPETSRDNNMYNLTVRFCDLKPDLLAVPFLYLGRQVRSNLSLRVSGPLISSKANGLTWITITNTLGLQPNNPLTERRASVWYDEQRS